MIVSDTVEAVIALQCPDIPFVVAPYPIDVGSADVPPDTIDEQPSALVMERPDIFAKRANRAIGQSAESVDRLKQFAAILMHGTQGE